MWVGEGMLSGLREGQPGIWEEKDQNSSIVVSFFLTPQQVYEFHHNQNVIENFTVIAFLIKENR